MLKRLLALLVAVAGLTLSGCGCSGGYLHCEPPCYGRSYHRAAVHMMDFVDVYLLNYDKHDPYRCEPCIGN